MNLEKICSQVIDLAKETGSFIREQQALITKDAIILKGKNDFVTYVDRSAEERLVIGLKKILPEAGFIVEEKTVAEENLSYKWVVDPLDGTTNFIHGLTPYAVSIGLMKDNEILVGVIYEAGLDECFYAWKNGGAWLNGNAMNTTKTEHLKDALIATGFPINNHGRLTPYLKVLDHFIRNSHGVRRMGSAAVDMAYVACGRFDAFYEYNLSAWDVAAGVIILKEAGGKISDFSKGDNYIFGKEIVATNGKLFEEVYREIEINMLEN